MSVTMSNTNYTVTATPDNGIDDMSMSSHKADSVSIALKTTSTFKLMHWEYYVSSNNVAWIAEGY